MQSSTKHLSCIAAAAVLAILLGLPAAEAFRFSTSSSAPVGHRRPQRGQWGTVMGRRCQQPTPLRMAAAPGEDGEQSNKGHSRRAALQLAGGLVFGPLAMAVGAGSAAAAALGGGGGKGDLAGGAMAGVSTHKSQKELMFEYMKLGLDLTHAFKFEEAEVVYTDLIQLFGSPLMLSDREKGLLAKAYSNRGNVRYNLNRLNEAVVDYSLAIELNPLQYEYWTNRGLAFESMAEDLLGDETREQDAAQFYEAAITNYEHSIILDPENHKLYATAGDVLTHLGRTDSALEYYRQALMLFPVSPALSGKVALLEIENGNIDRGTYLLDSLVHRHPEFSEMVLAAGAIDWTLGRFTDGIDKYSFAVERDPRLLDDKYLERERHWPPTMMKMVGKLREAGATDGLRSTAVSWFESRGTLI